MINVIYGRPELAKDMGYTRFLEFYYLETEMSDFCKKNGLNHLGDRNDLKNRIASFLSGGKYSQSKFIDKPPEEDEPENQPARGIFDGYYNEDLDDDENTVDEDELYDE